MGRLLIILLLRLLLSFGAIAILGAGLSIASGAAGERGVFDKRSLLITLLAWMMIEMLVYFFILMICSLRGHAGIPSRVYATSPGELSQMGFLNLKAPYSPRGSSPIDTAGRDVGY